MRSFTNIIIAQAKARILVERRREVFVRNLSIFFGLLMAFAACLMMPHAVAGQSEKLGIIEYTAPKGWTKTPNENVVAFSEVNKATGGFCIITLYGATPSTGKPQSDFTTDWTNLVVKTLHADANPKTESETVDGWILTSGASPVEIEGSKSLVLLTVYSGFGKKVSVLAVFNDQSYVTQIRAFDAGLNFDKTASAPAAGSVVPNNPPVGNTSAGSIYGIWSNTSISIANYVTPSGGFVGSADVSTAQEYQFRSDGTYVSKFFGSMSGRMYYTETTGTFRISGQKLTFTPVKRIGGYTGAIRDEKDLLGKPEIFDFYVGPNKWEPGPFLNLHKDGGYYLNADYPYDYYKRIEK